MISEEIDFSAVFCYYKVAENISTLGKTMWWSAWNLYYL
jgi:hypothetical protein